MDDRKLTVCYGRGNYKQAPPQIVLQGIYLAFVMAFALLTGLVVNLLPH